MTLATLLEALARAGARLRVEDGHLVVRAIRGAIDPSLRGELARRRSEILDRLQNRPGGSPDGPPSCVVDRGRRHEPFPLSPMQRAYLVGRSEQFPLGGVGMHFFEERDCPRLDSPRLKAAWERVVERHDALRTVVIDDARQQVREFVPGSAGYRDVDLSVLAPSECEARLAEIRRSLTHRLYDPGRWPWFEIVAARLAGSVRLFISLDGMHVDLRGIDLITRDWLRCYHAPGEDAPPPPLSYRDYLLAAASDPEKSDAGCREYWARRITELPEGPDLAYARPPELPSFTEFSGRSRRLDSTSWSRLKEQGMRLGLTPSALLLGTFADVLATWASSPRFAINVPTFNPQALHAAIDEVVGNFTATIPVAVDVPRDGARRVDRYMELQRRLREDLDRRPHDCMAISRAFAEGRASRMPAFPVVFTSGLWSGAVGFRRLDALGRRVSHSIQTPQVSLDLQVAEDRGGLALEWQFAREILPGDQVDAMSRAQLVLMRRLARGPEAWEDHRPLPIPARQRHRRERANATDAPIPDVDLSTWCRAGADSPADPPAVISGMQTLTHRELWVRVDSLATRLCRVMAPSGSARGPIAIVMRKGWEQVVAAHAILAAGLPYLPIDPDLPEARRHELIESSGVSIVLTQPQLARAIELSSKLKVLCVSETPEVSEAPPSAVRRGSRSQDDPAYVLYTSGSTGRPKGVVITGRSVVNRLIDVVGRFRIRTSDRMLGLTALHHDLSVFDLFATAATGACLVLPEAEHRRDPSRWLDLMIGHEVSIWNSVPAYFEMLLDELDGRGPRAAAGHALRLLLLSGDRVPVDMPRRAREHFGQGLEVVCLGGPTETTVWDIVQPIPADEPPWSSIPYGRPMANARYHVLGPNLADKPDGVMGELCIEGAGLALGYLNDPELTAERFLSHPGTGRRIYRSGDLGRYLADGSIEILGRCDAQMKIRGLRIDPTELELALASLPGVAEAAVAATGNGNHDRRLVALVVRASAGPPRQLPEDGVGLSSMGPSPDWQDRLRLKGEEPGLRRDLDDRPACPLTCGAPLQPSTRRTHRVFDVAPIRSDQLGGLLECLRGEDRPDRPLPTYRYPSAGNLYAVRAYLSIREGRVDGLAPGLYYYHPRRHHLIRVSNEVAVPDVHLPHNRPAATTAAVSIYLVGRLEAFEALYGERGRDYALIEAGAMLQLLQTGATAVGLGLCPVGSMAFQGIAAAMGLDGTDSFLHAMLCGRPADSAIDGSRALLTSSELRAHLARHVPEALIPSDIRWVDELPRTRTGKLDRTALAGVLERTSPASKPPAWSGLGRDVAGRVAEVVASLLGRAEVGLDDRFFELGCNSLTLVRLLAVLREREAARLSIVDLFANPTARRLAGRIEELSDGRSAPLGQGVGPVAEGVSRAARRLTALGGGEAAPDVEES